MLSYEKKLKCLSILLYTLKQKSKVKSLDHTKNGKSIKKFLNLLH